MDDAYEAAGRALWYAERAVELDPFLADAWAARGYIQMLARAPLALGRADFDQAGELEENNDNTLAWQARVLVAEGNDLDALLAVRQARDIAPGNAGRRVGVALHAFRLGRYVEAISEAISAYDLQSELMLARAFEARALLLSGGSEECLGLSLGPHAVIHAMCLHAQGRVDEARAIIDSVAALALQNDDADSTFTHVTRFEDLASYYAWLGEVVQANTWLLEAFTLSPTGIDVFVLESELFSPVRDDRRFEIQVDGARSGIWDRVKAESSEFDLARTP